MDVLPLDDLDRVADVREEVAHGVTEDLVALVLVGVDLDPERLETLEPFERLHHRDHLGRSADERLRLTDRLGADALDLVEQDDLAHVVCDVGDVVEPRGDADDVLAIERRDEGLVQAPEDLVGQLVAVVLDGVDVADLALHLGEVAQETLERDGRLEAVRRVLVELGEEEALLREQRKAHGFPSSRDTKGAPRNSSDAPAVTRLRVEWT